MPPRPARWRCSYEASLLAWPFHIAHAPPANLRMRRVRSHIRPALPTANAFGVGGRFHGYPDPASARAGRRYRARRCVLDPVNPGVRSDEEETQLLSQSAEASIFIRHAVDVDLCIEGSADGARVAQFLQLPRDAGAQLQQRGPIEVGR